MKNGCYEDIHMPTRTYKSNIFDFEKCHFTQINFFGTLPDLKSI